MSDLSGFGLRKSYDARDLVLPVAVTARRSRLWGVPPALDQGATSQCVAYAGTQYLSAAPIRNKPYETPAELYREAQLYDEWPGEGYEGTSVRGLFKALKKRGYVSEYRWAKTGEAVVMHVLAHGPVVMGTSWFLDMADPDRSGYLSAKGEDSGGHAWLVVGAYRDRANPDGSLGAVRMVNSWGTSWGREKGRAWITFHDLDKLVRTDGEACTATEVFVA